MTKKTEAVLRGVLWLARGTSVLVGLSVMLALTVGLGTAALAAVPGDPFKLGRINVIDALTTLAGNRAGPMLVVDNDSAAAGARALDLRVEQGRPPLIASPGAGKAVNLDADKLDGLNSTQLPRGFYKKQEQVTEASSASSAASHEVFCDDGDQVVGGGFAGLSQTSDLLASAPDGDGDQSWFVAWLGSDTIDVRVLCADFGTPHQQTG
jgi:hypothetical protein